MSPGTCTPPALVAVTARGTVQWHLSTCVRHCMLLHHNLAKPYCAFPYQSKVSNTHACQPTLSAHLQMLRTTQCMPTAPRPVHVTDAPNRAGRPDTASMACMQRCPLQMRRPQPLSHTPSDSTHVMYKPRNSKLAAGMPEWDACALAAHIMYSSGSVCNTRMLHTTLHSGSSVLSGTASSIT